MLIAFRSVVVAIIMLVMVSFSPLVIARPVDAVRPAGPTWDRTYVPSRGVFSVEQTRDNGFIMSASSGDIWGVMKANAAGMPEWQRQYIPMGYSSAGGVTTPTSDGGFILIGGAQSIGYVTGLDGWLLKLDHRGSVEWSRIYDLPGDEGFDSAQQTSDGGYIALGMWTPVVNGFPGFSQAWLVKLSPKGDIEWQHAYGTQHANSVQETSDGGFIVAGDGGFVVAGVSLNDQRAWLLKTDPLGNTVWQKAYAVPIEDAIIDDHARWVRQTSDGGYIAVSDVITFRTGGAQSSVAWILRLDAEGSIVWQKLFSGGGNGYTTPRSVDEMFDRGFLVAGEFTVSRSGTGPNGPWLLRLAADGSLVWQKIYGEEIFYGVSDSFSRAQETRDGGIIAVGSKVVCCTETFTWALKLDAQGNIHGCPIGVPSNATLTDTDSIVTDTAIMPVDTDATASPVDVTVTTSAFPVQDVCMALPSKNEN